MYTCIQIPLPSVYRVKALRMPPQPNSLMPTQRLLGRNLLWFIPHIFDSLWSTMEY